MWQLYFHSAKDFLHMGGYALYVWPAYAVVVVSLGCILLLSKIKISRIKKQLRLKKC